MVAFISVTLSSILTLCLFLQVVWMRNGQEVKYGKKYESVATDRKRILMVHNVTEEDVGIYDCVLADDRMSLQLTLRGMDIRIIATKYHFAMELLILDNLGAKMNSSTKP